VCCRLFRAALAVKVRTSYVIIVRAQLARLAGAQLLPLLAPPLARSTPCLRYLGTVSFALPHLNQVPSQSCKSSPPSAAKLHAPPTTHCCKAPARQLPTASSPHTATKLPHASCPLLQLHTLLQSSRTPAAHCFRSTHCCKAPARQLPTASSPHTATKLPHASCPLLPLHKTLLALSHPAAQGLCS
jgi:hypothetical protein